VKTIPALLAEVKRIQALHGSDILRAGTAASLQWDAAYARWIAARWDAGDRWVRSVWAARPEVSP
jgi:hypothetical protein